MSGRRGTVRSAEEWRDAFYNLDERHRQLQRKLNEQEREMKLLKVSQRRRSAPAAAALPGDANRSTPAVAQAQSGGVREVPSGVKSRLEDPVGLSTENSRGRNPERSVQFVGVPSAARREDAAAAAAEIANIYSGAPPPDPSMVWGMENSIQNYVTANALYHANEEMRQRLEDCVAVVKSLQHELAASRVLSKNTQSRLDEATQQIQQLVRERDIACQKLSVAQNATAELERQQKQTSVEEERIRFSLESQVTELRNRLVVGADSNELLSRDVRTLLAEVQEKTTTIQGLRSKLSLAETALASQRHTNENLLAEFRSLNSQLVEERKRLLAMTQEVHLANMRAGDIRDAEARLAAVVNDRTALEREHARLMESLVTVTEGALAMARAEVKQDLDEFRGSAAHWEEVAQLLYKDIAQRTQAHIHCREECEEAKRARDEAAVALRVANDELRSHRLKLDIVWPTHRADTDGLTHEQMLSIFGRYNVGARRGSQMQQQQQSEQHRLSPAEPTLPDGKPQLYDDDVALYGRDFVTALQGAPLDEQVRELQEANSALVAELQRLQVTNELQKERLRSLESQLQRRQEAVETATAELKEREMAGQTFLQSQLDRVSFLEAQVRSLRGYSISPTKSLCEVEGNETVFELFVGQILSTETPAGVELRNTFPPVFCSIDFLLHETVTTPVVAGLNAFLDTSVSFCVAMDALLLCYLQTRQLLLQLHCVRSQEELGETMVDNDETGKLCIGERLYTTVAEGSVSLSALVADPRQLEADRPSIRGHVPLRDGFGHHIASVEFAVTVRTPFSEAFRALAAEGTRSWSLAKHEEQQQMVQDPVSTVLAASSSRSSPLVAVVQRDSPICEQVEGGSEVRSVRAVSTPRHERRMVLVPTPHRSNATGPISSTSSSNTLLERSSSFTLVPRAAAIAAASAPNTVQALVVDVCKLKLPHDLYPVPRLSCYYALEPLGCNLYLHAPPTARYEYEYLQEGGFNGKRFPIGSLRELLAVTREPFILFFFDESAVSTTIDMASAEGKVERHRGQYWATARTEWRLALEKPEEFVSLELPLINKQGLPIKGATVRVRLLATCKGEGPQGENPAQREPQSLLGVAARLPEHRTRGFEGAATAVEARVVGIATNLDVQGCECPEDSIDMEIMRHQLGSFIP
ncbi:hypothetical protein DPX39_080033800 [Trypanosoma brucei equiperdum]|uniref:RPGR-interacting protein 1 first C2 domain-containing protein n=1 Tax=Trypanosoma brucei equiperdum TaxID=630700 RepID=A0A3L6L595_9TRYP|nr:hypothetical protein DPX39_080033800 [Trypanosoma brucei equiperdum]